jgi:hypothetical protein
MFLFCDICLKASYTYQLKVDSLVLFLFGVILGSLPLALVAGSCVGCVH